MPILGRWIRRRTAVQLARKARTGDPSAVELLAEALARHHDLTVRSLAAGTLDRLESSTAVDAFCASWARSRNQALEGVLMRAQYIAHHPMALRVLTAVKVGKPQALLALGEQAVEPMLAACRDQDPDIAAGARAALGALTDPAAKEALCHHLMAGEDADLAAVAIAANIAPRETAERALFYFVTEQWEAYENLDFQEERPLLRQAYSQASGPVRTAVLTTAKRTGMSSVVNAALARSSRRLKTQHMTAAEWEVISEGLQRESRWDELWRLCFHAPVNFAAQMVLALKGSSWQPPDHERGLWEKLRDLCPEEGNRLTLVVGELLRSVKGHAHAVRCLTMDPAGTQLAGTVHETVRVWSLGGDNQAAKLDGHADVVSALCTSPDGLFLVSGSKDRTVRLWNIRTGNLIKTLTGHRGEVSCLALNPSGDRLASGSKDSTVRIWTIPGGEHKKSLSLPSLRRDTSWVLCLAFSPDGRMTITGSKDSSVRLWRFPEGDHIKTLEGHRGGVLCLTVSPDGRRLASGGKEGSIRLWSLPEGRLVATLDAHQGGVQCMESSPDSSVLISGGHDGTVRLWRFDDGKALATLEGHRGEVSVLVRNPNGSVVVSGSSDCTVKIWSLTDGTLLTTLTGHTGRLRSLSVTPDGTILASGGDDRTLCLWHLTWTKPLALSGHEDLGRVKAILKDRDLREEDRRRWEFLEALLSGRFRYDIAIDQSVISLASHDIEIEIEEP